MSQLTTFRLVSVRTGAGLFLATLALATSSCGNGRKNCYPVAGTIHVDGKPVADAMIQLHSADPADHEGPNRVIPLAMTDETGKFKLSTYGDNDGAPVGEYAVTITWRQRSGLLKNQFDGPDRLKGKYNTKELSGLKVTIEKKPQELRLFELTTK